MSKRSHCGAWRVLLSLGEPSAEIVRVEALSLWRRAILLLAKWPLEVARLLSQSRGRGFDSPLVRGSSGLKSQLLSTNVVRGACSCSSGWKIATFKYKRRRYLLRALAQSNLHRALACSSLQRAMQLAQTTFVRNRAAQFVRSTLRRADSCRANLHRASCAEPLAKSSFRRANFHRAKLRRAILHRAKLRERALQKLWPSCSAARAKHIALSRLAQSQLAQSQLRRASREK